MRRLALLAALALGACQSSPPGDPTPAPVPVPTPTPVTPPTTVPPTPTPPPVSVGPRDIVVRATRGLYLVDPALPGEAAVAGDVEVLFAGLPPPAGTAVTLNGVALVARDLSGLPRTFWSVDPAGPQPVLGADGLLTLSVRAGGEAYALALPCPPAPDVATSTPVGASLGGQATLQLSLGAPLPENAANLFPADFFPVARLRGRDADTGAGTVDVISQRTVPAQALGVALDVGAAGSGGYLAELSYPGAHTVDGGSGGYCGRLRRFAFAP